MAWWCPTRLSTGPTYWLLLLLLWLLSVHVKALQATTQISEWCGCYHVTYVVAIRSSRAETRRWPAQVSGRDVLQRPVWEWTLPRLWRALLYGWIQVRARAKLHVSQQFPRWWTAVSFLCQVRGRILTREVPGQRNLQPLRRDEIWRRI